MRAGMGISSPARAVGVAGAVEVFVVVVARCAGEVEEGLWGRGCSGRRWCVLALACVRRG